VPPSGLGNAHGTANSGDTEQMARKASVVIEKDEHGFYTWCPQVKERQSLGDTLEEAISNIKEAIEFYLETLPANERVPAQP
jgi:predicted RNase H-like HicB family nuclease